MLTQAKRDFIRFMQDSDVLRFGSFVTKSGRNSPYFVNTGNYKTGGQIAKLGHFYAAFIHEVCGSEFDAMFGPAYKGIPLATAAAASLARDFDIDKPYFFNRKEAKDHGEGGNLIGYQPKDGDRIIIIEDVITAGTAIRETMPVLRQAADLSVRDMFISVNRCEVGQDARTTAVMEVYQEFGITVHPIVTVQDIRDYLEELGGHDEVLAHMNDYMKQYCLFQ